ncbi:NAD(+)/NADH kinase [Suttonella sp. R2A3]|uniref:NAD(+)/NADH kinase n=1 Tax=Suttonella sp. R2A3 TaxID=2908648 RepID=UPI001F2B41B7|nr:NAD(+)/NADH kinase [Suttonella sp. R2A3]UJF24937.1 NAD(+)/NADH kinase [Suttonella sp. R2A3]
MPQPVFKHIGIIGKYRLHDVEDTIRRVIALLDDQHIAYSLDQHTMPEALQDHPRSMSISAWPDEVDLCVVIGGDGTFLYAGRMLLEHQIPLVGINAGHLGFLADIPGATLEQELSTIFEGHYCSEIRHTLHVSVENDGVCQATFYAVNDAVIHKRNMARMIDLEVYTRERFLAHYRADGLIIATPTGSTAYALSAGGPIVEPSLPATLLVPICPHTLMQRPVVLDAQRVIRACLNRERFKDVQLTIDGQEEYIMQAGDQVVVRQAQELNVIHPAQYKFQQRLREKFHWGVAGEISYDRSPGSDDA